MIDCNDYLMIVNEFASYIKGSELEGHVYFVGGCVRDYYMGNDINDIDIVVDMLDGGMKLAKYLEFKGLISDLHEYPAYGVAAFTVKSDIIPDGIQVEAVHTRKEIYNHINRNPVTEYGTIEEDAKRRDLTVNALYHNISSREIISPLGDCCFGDFDNKVLDTCDDPITTFTDDPLRIFRVIRFACKPAFKKFHISSRILEALKLHNFNIGMLAWERITTELSKMAEYGDYQKALGGLKMVIKDTEKFSPYIKDTLDAYNPWDVSFSLPGSTIGAFMATFYVLHTGYYHDGFTETLKSMKIPNDEIKKALNIIEVYDAIMAVDWLKNTFAENRVIIGKLIRQFVYKHKTTECVNYALVISKFVHDYNQAVMFFTKNEEHWASYRLPVTGDDVMRIRNIGPGPEVKVILDECLDAVFENPDLNNNTYALEDIIRNHRCV